MIAIDDLKNTLNSDILSLDSLQGCIFLLLLLFILFKCGKKMIEFARWCVGLIFIFQIGHILAGTALNHYLPLSTLFKYDVLTSLAQLCVGTKLSDMLLWLDVYSMQVGNTVVNCVMWIGRIVLSWFT